MSSVCVMCTVDEYIHVWGGMGRGRVEKALTPWREGVGGEGVKGAVK